VDTKERKTQMIQTADPLSYNKYVNGNVYGYQNLTIAITTDKIIEIKDQFEDINYTWTLEKQKLTGLSPVPVGFTSGQVDFKGSFTLSKRQSKELEDALTTSVNRGVGNVPFTITVSYGPILSFDGQISFTRDILMGCFITSGDQSHSSGSALKVKHDFVFCNLSSGGIAVV